MSKFIRIWKLCSVDYPEHLVLPLFLCSRKKEYCPYKVSIKLPSVINNSTENITPALDDTNAEQVEGKTATPSVNNSTENITPTLDDTNAEQAEALGSEKSEEYHDNSPPPRPEANQAGYSKWLKFVIVLTLTFIIFNRPENKDCNIEIIDSYITNIGKVEYSLQAECRTKEKLKLHYKNSKSEKEYIFSFFTDNKGMVFITLDLFLGRQPLHVIFDKDLKRLLPLPERDLFNEDGSFKNITKAAIVWQSPVDIDIHAYEYGARHGEKGHIWNGKAATHDEKILENGGGYISHFSDENSDNKYEVYSFIHHRNNRQGDIEIKVDFSSRGEIASGQYCKGGKYSSPSYQTIFTAANNKATEDNISFGEKYCGETLNNKNRYLTDGFTLISNTVRYD